MKYLKITMALFAITLCGSLMGVDATQYTQLIDITIPSFSASFLSEQVDKGDDWTYNQRVKKISAVDNISKDGRALSAKIRGMFSGSTTTDWQSIPQGKNITFEDTAEEGGYKLMIKSDKSLLTTATASVNWDLGSISYSPYPIKGSR